MMLTRACLLFASILGTGCISVTPIPLTKESESELRQRTVVLARYEKPSFYAFEGHPAAGLLGLLVASGVGKKMLEQNKIVDPASQIGDEFGQALTEKYEVKVSGLNRPEVDFEDIDRLVKYYQEGDIILDVKTLDWGIGFQMPAGYWLTYHARLRLIDRASQKILAQERCSRPRESLGGATSFDEIRENEAAALKQALLDAVRACTAYFRAQFIK
jgi:hypothetical protein